MGTAWSRVSRILRLPQVARVFRFCIQRRLARANSRKSRRCCVHRPLIIFDIRSEKIFKRYLFTIARGLFLVGAEVQFRFRFRFITRDVEPGDFELLMMPDFRFRLFPPLRRRPGGSLIITDAPEEFDRAVIAGRSVIPLRAVGSGIVTVKESLPVVLTLGPRYIHDHSSWVPDSSLLAASQFSKRTIGAFFSGAINKPAYRDCSALNAAGVYGRVQVVEWLRSVMERIDGEYVDDYEKSHLMLNDDEYRHVVIVDAQTAGFSGDEYRNVLLRSRFFIGLPGIASVYTHSLVEALACGVVPIVQQSIELHSSFLNGVNCLTFNTLDELGEILNRTKTIGDVEWNRLSANCVRTYHNVFSPEAIGTGILEALRDGRSLTVIQA